MNLEPNLLRNILIFLDRENEGLKYREIGEKYGIGKQRASEIYITIKFKIKGARRAKTRSSYAKSILYAIEALSCFY